MNIKKRFVGIHYGVVCVLVGSMFLSSCGPGQPFGPTQTPTPTVTPTPTQTLTPTSTSTPIPPTSTPTKLEAALKQADTWASVVAVIDLFGGDTTNLPEVKLLNQGAADLLSGDIDSAISPSEESFGTTPSSQGYNWLGAVFPRNSKNNSDMASVKSVPSAALCNLGIALKLKGNLDESEKDLRQAVELQADFYPAYNNLGWLLKSKQEWEAAINAFHEAIKLEPDYIEAQGNLGVTLYLMGEKAQALVELQKARDLFQAAKRSDDVAAIDVLLFELK